MRPNFSTNFFFAFIQKRSYVSTSTFQPCLCGMLRVPLRTYLWWDSLRPACILQAQQPTRSSDFVFLGILLNPSDVVPFNVVSQSSIRFAFCASGHGMFITVMARSWRTIQVPYCIDASEVVSLLFANHSCCCHVVLQTFRASYVVMYEGLPHTYYL